MVDAIKDELKEVTLLAFAGIPALSIGLSKVIQICVHGMGQGLVQVGLHSSQRHDKSLHPTVIVYLLIFSNLSRMTCLLKVCWNKLQM